MRPGNGFTTEAKLCRYKCDEDERVCLQQQQLPDRLAGGYTVLARRRRFRILRPGPTRKARGEHLVIVVSAFVSLIVKTAPSPEPARAALVVRHCNMIKPDRSIYCIHIILYVRARRRQE